MGTKKGGTGIRLVTTLSALAILAMLALTALGAPVGPSLNYISDSTSSSQNPTLVDNSSHTGGTIAVMNMDARQQNPHWKAYVGNITGKLILEDALNYSIYEWTIGTVQGEVYATRKSSVTWSTVRCANETNINSEMLEMNHTSQFTPNDNISATFLGDKNNHAEFYAGPNLISANSCNYTTNLYINDTAQSTGAGTWEEVVLFDTTTNATIYTSIIENNQWSYQNGTMFDYQILLPEKGEPGFQGSATPYYFYVELV